MEEGFDRADDNEDQRQPVDRVDGDVGGENQPVFHRVVLTSKRAGRFVFSQAWKQAAGLNSPLASRFNSVHAGGGLVHRLQRVVEREGVGLLDRREVLEGRRPLRRGRLRAVDHEDAVAGTSRSSCST